MKKQPIVLINLILFISLLGIIIFQFSWINQIVKLNDESFKKEIQEILSIVSIRLEEKEIYELTKDNLQSKINIKRSNQDGQIELIESSFVKKILDSINSENTTNDFLRFNFETGDQQVEKSSPSNTSFSIEKGRDDFKVDSSLQNEINKLLVKSEVIQLVLNQLLNKEKTLDQRIDKEFIQTLLVRELENKGINLEFQFAVIESSTKNEIVSTIIDKELLNSSLKTQLYPNDIGNKSAELLIHFPNQERYLFGKILFSLVLSLIFLGGIIYCFYYAISTIYKQKKLSDIKNDFIDNMTHELKTPISTISLACEALEDPKIKPTIKMNKKYLKIIGDENKRLSQQVEKVLQIAVLDKNNSKLKFNHISLHSVLKDSIDIIGFQIEKNKGRIKKNFIASNDLINGDEMHLINVFNNLLDNANKYSGKQPKIIINTYNSNNSITVEVKDNGVGMKNSVTKRIFEKFYREPKGNIHNVKGFGLGLSYVKSMIKEHKAKIFVKSKVNKGSLFQIKFKLADEKK